MLITKLLIRSFRIVRTQRVESDTLDPEYLEFACETLVRAHATLSLLPIGGDEEDPVFLGLGWPDDIPELRGGPGVQQVVGQVFAELPELTGTVFYLQHQGSGPVYVVLPAEDEPEDEASAEPEETEGEATLFEDVVEQMQSMQLGDLHAKLARFETLWSHAMDSRPAVLQFGPSDWGEQWDLFALYLAAAILLEE